MTTALMDPPISDRVSGSRPARYTADDLVTLPDGDRYELIDGQLVEQRMGVLSSWVAGQIHFLLRTYVTAHPRLLAFPENTGFQCFPESNRVRRADAAVISADRMTQEFWSEGHLKIAPDLAVEVVSPHDTYNEVTRKVADWTAAGVPLLWVVDPESRTVVVHRKDSDTIAYLTGDAQIAGEGVLPGFSCRICEFFPPAPNPIPATEPPSPATP